MNIRDAIRLALVCACVLMPFSELRAATGKPPVINTPSPGQTNVPYLNFESTGHWTDGAPLGVIQLFEIPSGDGSDTNNWFLLRERDNAATATLDMPVLHPGTLHVIRYRNVTARDDPWVAVFFTTAPDSAGHLTLTSFSPGSLALRLDGMYPNRTLTLQYSTDLGQWNGLVQFVPSTMSTNISCDITSLAAPQMFLRLSGPTPPP